MTKEIMINCSNRILKSYIFNLQHENAELKKYFCEIEDIILEPSTSRCIGRNSLEYYAILSSSIKFQIQALKERASLSDPQSQQLQIKKLKVAFSTYRRMQFGKDLRRQEYEYLYLIENLLEQLEDKKMNNKNFYDNAILLQQDEQTLLNKIFGEYYKQLKTEQLSNQDRVMEPYFEEAITKLINLGEKLKVIINV